MGEEHEEGVGLCHEGLGKCRTDSSTRLLQMPNQSIKSLTIADGDRLIDFQCPFLPISSLPLRASDTSLRSKARVDLTCRSWSLALKTLERHLVSSLICEWKTGQISEQE